MESEHKPSSRKRRLSRKERKQLKRLQKRSRVVGTDQDQDGFETKDESTDAATDYASTYVPTNLDEFIPKSDMKSVGKWFPKATKLKRDPPDSSAQHSAILLFYQYFDASARFEKLRQYLIRIGNHRVNLAGRIRVAPEGLNATLSAVDTLERSALETLHHFCMDLRQFDPIFESTDFKFLEQLHPDRHFSQLTVLPVKELVFYGLNDQSADLRQGGTHVSAEQFHEFLGDDKKETVVIDVRNHYEAAIGRFDGQANGGAKYIDPKMRKSTDFPSWLADAQTQEQLKGKRVLMFCTGGVRCERASAHLKQTLAEVPEVYQLQGGIERYLKAFPDGGFWRGKNFVFDKREAVSASNPNGDGGVLKQQEVPTKLPECVCANCSKPWDRYLGKKKCMTCGVPILLCDECLGSRKSARCPLCVEQNVTVKLEDVDFTNNGVGVVTSKDGAHAASSVCKWGGGHGGIKRKWKKRPCKFGAACTRTDCFFAHPERNDE